MPAAVLIGLLAGVMVGGAEQVGERPCNGMGECLSDGFAGLALLLVTPIVLYVAMLLVRFPARDRLAVGAFVVLGLVAREALRRLHDWAGAFAYGLNQPPSPYWWWLVTMPLVFLAGWLLVRRTATAWWLRIVPAALVLALGFGVQALADRAERTQTAGELAAVGTTLYRPTLPHSVLMGAWGSETAAHLSFESSDPIGFPTVLLIPAQGRSACAAAASELVLGLDDDTCTGEEFRSTDGGYHAVGLTRGTTVLVAYAKDSDNLDADTLLTALRTAPEISARELADAAKNP